MNKTIDRSVIESALKKVLGQFVGLTVSANTATDIHRAVSQTLDAVLKGMNIPTPRTEVALDGPQITVYFYNDDNELFDTLAYSAIRGGSNG